MKITKREITGIGIALALLVINFIFLKGTPVFYFLIGISFLILILPFLTSIILEKGREKEKEEKFLEFCRNLVESVKSGTPVSRSIINVANKNYGSLSPNIKKLANQISSGIPLKKAFIVFSNDLKNRVISRSVELIIEAEKSGGEIGTILESVAKSVTEIENIKKERKAAMFNLIVQGYIIFLIFIIIMLVVQYKFIPLITQTLGNVEFSLFTTSSFTKSSGIGLSTRFLNKLFLILLIVQGFFAGLVIGKLSENSIKSGLKHSFILMTLSYLITTAVSIFA